MSVERLWREKTVTLERIAPVTQGGASLDKSIFSARVVSSELT